MPPQRRRPSPQPSRRPQVAGTRRLGDRPAPRPRPQPYSAQEEDLPRDELLADGTQAPEVEEPEVDDHDTAVAPVEPEEAPEELAPEEVASVPAETRPKPRPKSRDTGTLRPTTTDEIEPEPAAADFPEPPAPAAAGGKRRGETPFYIAVALAAVFAVAAGLLAWQYFATSSVSDNQAHVDPLTSDQIQTDVKEAVKTLFSYDWQKLDGRAQQVNDVLASGKLKDQFAALNCAVEEEAPKQKILTSTQVSYSAVTDLRGDTAKLIVFVENAWQRQSTKQQGTGAGSLGITAQRIGDEWKIQDINIYGGETGKKPKVPEKCK